MALMGAAFTSCSKDIAFDNEAVAQQQIAEYQANFVKKYGPVDPNQTWDFSNSTPISHLTAGPGATRSAGAASSPITVTKGDGTLTVNETFLTWVHDNMKPGNDNAVQGIPFKFLIPNHPFTIAPIFQGKASYYWELWMHVGSLGEPNQLDEKVWSKGEDLKYQVKNDATWRNAGTGEVGTKDAVAVQGPTFTFTFEDEHVGRTMFFYLKVWGSEKAFNNDPTKTNCSYMSSTDMQMLALRVDNDHIPANLPHNGQDVHIIGCEDSPLEGSGNIDRDYEDLVFLTDGLELTDVKYVERQITKRFLIEDLGAIDDFDFNDIVVDIVETWTEELNYEYKANGSWKALEPIEVENTRHQEAIIRAMGGTIDFHLYIEDAEKGKVEIFKKSDLTDYAITDMLNTGWGGTLIDPYAEYAVIKNCTLNAEGKVIEGSKKWTFADNNIAVKVENIGDNGKIITEFKFPKEGEIPMIIATSTDKFGAQEAWKKERVSISKDWFFIPGEE